MINNICLAIQGMSHAMEEKLQDNSKENCKLLKTMKSLTRFI